VNDISVSFLYVILHGTTLSPSWMTVWPCVYYLRCTLCLIFMRSGDVDTQLLDVKMTHTQ